MEKLIIYPYSISFSPFLRHLAAVNKYDILSAVVPGNQIYNDIDASYIDEGSEIGVLLQSDFEKQLEKCETILWSNYEYIENETYFNKVVFQMENALEMNKNIICYQKLDLEIVENLKLIAKRNNCKFKYIYDYEDKDKETYEVDQKDEDIYVPIITVMGVSENCSKFETQLSIRRDLINRGYKVSQIGSREGCELLGFHSFPKFMTSNNFSEVNKIDLFKKAIIKIQQEENPDVIIVGIPGGIISFNEKNHMHYGIYAYEICNAINPDYNIVNAWVDTFNLIIYDDLQKITHYRYSTKIDSVCLSNISIFNDYSVIDRLSLEYNVYNKNKVDDKIKEIGLESIYNVVDLNSMNKLAEDIIEKLSK